MNQQYFHNNLKYVMEEKVKFRRFANFYLRMVENQKSGTWHKLEGY